LPPAVACAAAQQQAADVAYSPLLTSVIGPRRTGLIGRAAELAALASAAEEARRGHGGLVLVHGEAGVGKSRLCREFAASVGDALHLRGQAYSGDAVVAHAILVDTLRAARRDPSSTLWDAARSRTSALGAVVPELLADDGGTVQFDDEARIFESVLDLCEEVGAGRLVVWLAEDGQWADAASWRFLHYCSRRAQTMRLLVLATFRDDESLPDEPAWTRLAVLGTRDGVARVALSRLSEADTERMVRDVYGASLRAGVARMNDWIHHAQRAAPPRHQPRHGGPPRLQRAR
jgi:hypothetical protein